MFLKMGVFLFSKGKQNLFTEISCNYLINEHTSNIQEKNHFIFCIALIAESDTFFDNEYARPVTVVGSTTRSSMSRLSITRMSGTVG